MWPFTKRDVPLTTPTVIPNPEFTPDLPILENKNSHWLFNYGDEFRHRPLGSAAFTDEKMIMWVPRTGEGAQPVALQLHVPRNIPRGRIGGLLYKMTTKDLVYLDEHMENGVVFKRKKIKLRLPFDNQTRKGEYRHYTEFRAWTYIGTREYWAPRLDWDATFRKWSSSNHSPATHMLAGNAWSAADRWIRSYYQFNRVKPEPIKEKIFLVFRDSGWEPSTNPPQETSPYQRYPVPGDDMKRYY